MHQSFDEFTDDDAGVKNKKPDVYSRIDEHWFIGEYMKLSGEDERAARNAYLMLETTRHHPSSRNFNASPRRIL